MKRTERAGTLAMLLALVCVALPGKAHARDRESAEDRVGIFSHMVISEDQPAGDVVCAFCSVTVNGDVHGDVAVIFSSVMVGEDRTISGDVATLFSSLVMGEDSRINGDLAMAMGSANLADSARVHGDRAVFSSGLGLMVVLAPVLILIGVIWLLVWVVRRMIF